MLNWLRRLRPSKKPEIQPRLPTPSTSLRASESTRPRTPQKSTANQGSIEGRQPVLVRGELWKNTVEVRRELPRVPEALNDTDVASLIKGLARVDRTEIRRSAAEGLGCLGPSATPAISALLIAAIDVEASVRDTAVRSLRAIDPAWPKNVEARKAIPTLVAALKSWFADVSSAAFELLQLLGVAALPDLAAALSTGDDSSDKISVMHLLARLGPAAASAVPVLTRMLSSRFLQTRIAAAEALTAIGPAAASAVPVLTTGLSDSYADARQAMATCLAHIGPAAESAVPGLLPLLADRQFQVREAAASALEHIGPLTIPPLIVLTQARDAERLKTWLATREKVSGWQGHPQPGIVVIEADKLMNNLCWAAYEIVVDLASPEIAQETALQLLGKFGPAAAEAVPVISQALTDPNLGIVLAAIQALGKIGPEAKSAVPNLMSSLTCKDELIRTAAVTALDNIDHNWRASLTQSA
jgi:HEAT repeat protein